MDKVKIGIIGTGVGLRTYYPAFSKMDNVEIVAISGSNKERSEYFAEKYGIPMACSNYKELCDIKDIDLVCITAPNKFHFDMVKYAMKKNKHIICEKPVSESLDEIKKLDELSKRYSKILIVDHQLRYNPYMTKIKEIVENKNIGDIYLVKVSQEGTSFANLDAKWTWSFDANESGGVRLAMASHFNDLIQYWFNNKDLISVLGNLNPVFKHRKNNAGEIQEVRASTICNAIIQLSDEISVMYSINAGAFDKFKFEIDMYGNRGQLHFDLQDKLSIFTIDKIGIKQKVEVNGVFEDELMNKASLFSGSFRYFAPKIINAINGDVKEISRSTKIEEAIYNCNILDAIKESANSGKSVNFKKEKKNYA